MPRKAKDEKKIIEEKTVKKEAISKSKSTKKTSSNDKKETKTTTKKSTSKTKKTPSKETKKVDASKSKKVTKKSDEKIKKTAKKTDSKKATSKKTTTKKSTKSKIEVIEYYDLPYRYNQTVVKVLAQTPNTLFVYWDISDEDKNKYIEQYGEYFFNNTKPVLIVHNKSNNSSFEVDINDFANSWYLNIDNSNCDYKIELGRRPINQYVNIENNYLHITTSNNIEAPNDRILFDKLNNNVYFRNVKTNITYKKDIINLSLLKKIANISNVKEFYKELYPDEYINFDKLDLSNPSSSNPTSSFK